MTTHPFENLDPAQTVQVLPRHLAGPGEVDPRTAWGFAFDEGWLFAQTDAGTAAAFSPCLRLQATFDPQPDMPGKGTWITDAHRVPFTEPTWRMAFDTTTPIELLRDAHTGLLDLHHRDRLFDDGTAPHEAYTQLLASGWSHHVKTDGTQTFLTPDGLGGLEHCYAINASSTSAWRAWGGNPSEPHWKARFSTGTPTTLVAAFTTSLISTKPLHRTVQDVPAHTRRALHVTTTTTRQRTATHRSPHRPPPRAPAEPADVPPPPDQGALLLVHARPVRSTAVALAVTGTLTWAPTAHAVPFEPIPSTPAAPAGTQVPDTGSVEITTQDATGDALLGATFLLLDSAGEEAGRGKTDAQGKATFPDLAPGVYRLKQTATGSPLHEAAADRDVIVTPGATTRLTITDPFKAARILLRAKDAKTGRLLPGATVNIGTGASTLLTLTTGAKGTANGKLPMPSRKTQFWAKEIKAPAGYDLYQPAKSFTASPGAPVTVTVTNARSVNEPQFIATEQDEGELTDTLSMPTDAVAESTSGGSMPKTAVTGALKRESLPTPASSDGKSASPTALTGSLARTGADATPWILGGAGLLLLGGISAFITTHRRTGSEPQKDENAETN